MRKAVQRQHQYLLAMGNAVRDHRITLRLSQAELAEHCGVHRTYITEMENGQRNVSLLTLHKVAEGLGVKTWQILQFE